jgi:hypothetical protein
MAVEAQIIPVGENEQVTLTAPKKALALRRLNKSSVEVFLVSEKDLLALVGAEKQVDLPKDVRTFAQAEGILPFVERAAQAVQEVFTGAERMIASLKQDEYGDPFVAIEVFLDDPPEVEAEKYSACVERWANLLSPAAAGKIHLSTSWAEK